MSIKDGLILISYLHNLSDRLDCIYVKGRDNHTIINKAVYIAIGVNMEGKKELLGIWVGKNEGSKFWMQVVTELKNRGIEKIYVACVDGLKGFPEAINSVFPSLSERLCKYDIRISPSLIDIFPFLVISTTKYGKLI